MWPGLGAAGRRTLGGPRAHGGSLVAGSGSRILQGWCPPQVDNVSSQWWLTSSRIWVQNTLGVGDKLLAELGSEVWAVGPRVGSRLSDHWCCRGDCLLTQLGMRLWRSWCWLAVPEASGCVGGLCEHGFLVSGVCPLMFEADLEASTGFCWACPLVDGAGSWQQLLGDKDHV